MRRPAPKEEKVSRAVLTCGPRCARLCCSQKRKADPAPKPAKKGES